MLEHLKAYKGRYGVLAGTVLVAVGGYLTGTIDLLTAASQIATVVLGG